MLVVQIFSLDERGKNVEAGALFYDGRVITATPRSTLMQSVLDEPVRDRATGGTVTAQSDPIAWLTNLRFHYKSAYLRATEPVQSQETPPVPA